MFIRYRKVKNGKVKIQIVENERIRNKVRQKILRHVATAKDEQEVEQQGIRRFSCESESVQ
jgi:peptide subunit release factor 1 (eRF1)